MTRFSEWLKLRQKKPGKSKSVHITADGSRLDSFIRAVDNLEKDWEKLQDVGDKESRKPKKSDKPADKTDKTPKPKDKEAVAKDKKVTKDKEVEDKDDEKGDLDVRGSDDIS